MTDDPQHRYQALLDSGEIQPDSGQKAAVLAFQKMHDALNGYVPATGQSSWKAWFDRRKQQTAPKGLYLWGGVGRGKSMLMDMFFETAPVEHKQRVHFHAFMLEVHDRLHRFRQAAKAGKVEADRDPMPALARVIVDKAWLLCFDEFQVNNITDAMILGRLFTALFEAGVVVVATSNVMPDNLYKDGLQRDRFLPFIDVVKQHMTVMEIDDGSDHRLGRIQGRQVYHSPLSPEATQELERTFFDLTDTEQGEPVTLEVQGRKLQIPRAARNVAFVSFEDLCAKALGAADYLVLAQHFDTVIMDGIPKLGPENRNEARRFVHLVDALYEAHCKFICAADASPVDLHPAGDTAFEFQRTASRLIEMQADDYIAAPHAT
ncbi:cell division protein ZapE [Alphaproteobacteria bacterium HT1-32]|nr:cell division protein ZapE [Alphaproteobacteria bacterium HT1-32]